MHLSCNNLLHIIIMSYSDLKNLLNKKSNEDVINFVQNVDDDKLCDMICSRICNSDIAEILKKVLQSFHKDERAQQRKRRLIVRVLDALCDATVTATHVDRIINVIVVDFPNFSTTHLLKLLDYCVGNINNEDDEIRSWKDLIPSLLELLQDKKYIHYRGNEISGAEYKSTIIKSICTDDWSTNKVTCIAKMFREISMEKSEHDLVMRALCDKLLSVELNELPPLVHQLLKLTSEQNCRLLMLILCKYFAKYYSENSSTDDADSYNQIGKTSLKEVQNIQGTVLYHIYQAVKLKHKILKEFLKFLKNNTNAPEFVLDPFIASVLFLTAEFFKDQVFEILKAAVIRQIQDEEKRKHSIWLKSMATNEWNVMDAMSQVIENSNKDSQLALKGITDFAFMLMSIERKSKDDTCFGEIGPKILQKVIQKRHAAGSTILQQLINGVIDNCSSISYYADCLSFICRKMTMVVLDNVSWIVGLLEDLPVLPGPSATLILYSIVPLIRISFRVRESLVLILRKCLYRKGTATRIMAVIGFLELAKQVKINMSGVLSQTNSTDTSNTTSMNSSIILTQVTMEGHAQRGSVSNITLYQEILGILKKCFSHETEVRLALYHGLYDVIIANPGLLESVSRMLLDHFLIFYEPDENILPPVLLEKCIIPNGAEMIIQEPIGDLIYILQKVYVRTAALDFTVVENLATILESLCKRMSQTDVEHLDLSDATDFDNFPKAMMKIQFVKLCLTIYEALISYRIDTWSLTSNNFAQNIHSLLKGYNRLIEITKRINKPKKETKKKDKNDSNTSFKKSSRHNEFMGKLPNTIMEIKTINKILSLLYEDSVPWTSKEQSEYLRVRTDFHHYILQNCLQLFQQAKSLTQRGVKKIKDRYIKEYFNVANLLYNHIVCDLEKVRNFDEQCALLGLECFKEICDLMCTIFPDELSNFLSAISPANELRDLDFQIREISISIMKIMKNILNEEEDEDMAVKKIPVILIETVSHLIYKLPFMDENNKEILDWLCDIAKEVETESIAQIILRLLLCVEERIDSESPNLSELCIETCLKAGEIEETELEETPKFNIVNENTIKHVYNLLNNAVKTKLSNVAWFLGRLKAEQSFCLPGLGEQSVRENLKEKDRKLCCQLNVVMKILEVLTNVAANPGHVDVTFKNLHLLYNTLSHLVKYFYIKSSAQNSAFQSVGFISVVQRAGKSLKCLAYNLIIHTEGKQEIGKSSDTNVQRNKILKETKAIPRMIYEIEQFQKDLLLLEKKTGVPLEKYTKHGITRDFRIKDPELQKCLEKLETSMLNTQNTTHNSIHERSTDDNTEENLNADESTEDNLNEDENDDDDGDSSSTIKQP